MSFFFFTKPKSPEVSASLQAASAQFLKGIHLGSFSLSPEAAAFALHHAAQAIFFPKPEFVEAVGSGQKKISIENSRLSNAPLPTAPPLSQEDRRTVEHPHFLGFLAAAYEDAYAKYHEANQSGTASNPASIAKHLHQTLKEGLALQSNAAQNCAKFHDYVRAGREGGK